MLIFLTHLSRRLMGALIVWLSLGRHPSICPSSNVRPSIFSNIFSPETTWPIKISKGAKTRSQYNQVPHPTQDTNGKVTNSQLDTTNESQEVSPFPAGDHKAHINRRAQRHRKHKTEQKRSVKYLTGGLKPV